MSIRALLTKKDKISSNEKGNNLVEAALLFPVFLLIFLGVADLGMGFTTYISLSNAAREGSRWMTIHPDDKSGTQTRIYHEIRSAGLTPADVSIEFTPNRDSYDSGDTVTIRINHEYTLLFGAFTALPPVPLRIDATMRVLYDS